MRVLLAHKFFHLTGGAEVFFMETGRLLASKGHDVVYFSTKDKQNVSSAYEPYFVKSPEYISGSLAKRASRIGRMVYSFEVKRSFKKLLADTKPDIVHVFAIHVHLTPSILVAAFEAGVPVVMSCNEYKHICPNYKLFHHGKICRECLGGRFYRAVVNKCCKDSYAFSTASAIEAYVHSALGIYRKYVDMYLFSSAYMAKETEKFWGVGAFRWDTLRNPFDSKKLPFSPEYDNYGLYFGRLAEEKGVSVLLEAAAKVPHVRLVIVGNGPEESNLGTLAEDLGLKNVTFTGAVWGDALDALIRRTRFVVVPSVWHENFPYVINQAFAYGKPVIGAKRGGITELVANGERGITYPANDIDALANAMADLWESPAEAVEMGKRAKEFSDAEFNDERQYETLMRIYRKVLDARTSSRR